MKNFSFTKIPFTNRLIIFLLALFVAAAFHNCLQNDFVGDDKALFSGNEFYKSLTNFPKIFSQDLVMNPSTYDASQKTQSFSGCVSYRPVSAATFFIDYALWKNNPTGHHFSNIFLHFLTCILVFYFILRISGNKKIAFWAASFFAVHPIQSEVVNASGYRSDILMTMFYLCAVLAYARFSEAKRKGLWFGLVGVSYFLALFSKETAVTFPFIIFIVDWFFLSAQKGRQILGQKKGLYAVLAGITIFYLCVYFILIPNVFYLQPSPYALKGLAQIVLMLKLFLQYCVALVLPFKVSVLPPLYAPPIFPMPIWELMVPLVVSLLSIILAVNFFRRDKIITFGFVWFFVNYFPASGIFPLLNPLAFRFLYLPSIGFFLLFAIGIDHLAQWFTRRHITLNMRLILPGVWTGFLIILTIANNDFFRNNFVACREMIRRYPDSSRPYWILGLDSYLAGHSPQAVKYLTQHLKVAMNNPFISSDKEKFMTYHLLSKAAATPDAAIGYLKKAIELAPGFSGLYLELSRNYLIKKDYVSAKDCALQAMAVDSQSVLAYVFVIHINIEAGDLPQARTVLAKAQEKFDGDMNLKAVENYLNQAEKKND